MTTQFLYASKAISSSRVPVVHDFAQLISMLERGAKVGLVGEGEFVSSALGDLGRACGARGLELGGLGVALVGEVSQKESWVRDVPRMTRQEFESHGGKKKKVLEALRVERSDQGVAQVGFSLSMGLMVRAGEVMEGSRLAGVRAVKKLVDQVRQSEAMLSGVRVVVEQEPLLEAASLDWLVVSTLATSALGLKLGTRGRESLGMLYGSKTQLLEALGKSKVGLVRQLDGVRDVKRIVFEGVTGYRLDSTTVSPKGPFTLHVRRHEGDVSFLI